MILIPKLCILLRFGAKGAQPRNNVVGWYTRIEMWANLSHRFGLVPNSSRLPSIVDIRISEKVM